MGGVAGGGGGGGGSGGVHLHVIYIFTIIPVSAGFFIFDRR